MGRPPKYDWEPIDKLIEAGMSVGEIARQTKIPVSTIEMRIRRKGIQVSQSQNPCAVKSSEDVTAVPQTARKPASNPPQTTPNTPAELAEIAAQNETLQWLDRIDKIDKNNAVLATVLQSRIGRYLERNPDLRACDIANIASSLSTLESIGGSKSDLGLAIQTFIKYGLFDKRTSAYLVRAVVGDRDASLAQLRRIVRGDFG